MGLFSKKNGGFSDVIRCDEASYLMWKWHPSGVKEGESKRENEIRFGSSLRVGDGEVAVFVYKQKNGTMQDYIEGPFDQKLQTKNLPILSSIIGLGFEGNSPFQAEVYFINLQEVQQARFGVPYFDLFDPQHIHFGVPTSVRGSITFKIEDYKSFIKCNRLRTVTKDEFQLQIRDATIKYVKSIVSATPTEANIPVLQIERRISEISDRVEAKLKERLAADFGVTVSGVDVTHIELQKDSEGYQSLLAITRDLDAEKLRAKAIADIARTTADAENYSETLRMQREESRYAAHMRTQSANLGAFQIEKQAEVGVAGAEALGQMGSNGAGGVDLGGGGGFNPAAMMTSMAVGGVVGQNIASIMGGAMSGASAPATPPPIPVVSYHVAKDGRSTGPFDLTQLTAMIASGELLPDSLVWKSGMAAWQRADATDDLKGQFPPPIV